jgi:hypothetical protein
MGHRVNARSIHRLSATAVLAFAWVACGSEESPPAAPETSAVEPAAEMSAEPAPEVAPPFPARQIHEAYPNDVPIYPGAVPGPALSLPGGLFATFQSEDEATDVIEHFRTALGDAGWTLDEESDRGINFSKDGRSVRVRTRATDTGKTEIAVNIREG